MHLPKDRSAAGLLVVNDPSGNQQPVLLMRPVRRPARAGRQGRARQQGGAWVAPGHEQWRNRPPWVALAAEKLLTLCGLEYAAVCPAEKLAVDQVFNLVVVCVTAGPSFHQGSVIRQTGAAPEGSG